MDEHDGLEFNGTELVVFVVDGRPIVRLQSPGEDFIDSSRDHDYSLMLNAMAEQAFATCLQTKMSDGIYSFQIGSRITIISGKYEIVWGFVPSSSVKFPHGMTITNGPRQIWVLASFLFSQETRERYYEPAHWDLLAQHLKAKRHTGKWPQRWLAFCFGVRTVKLVAECMWMDWRLWILAMAGLVLPRTACRIVRQLLCLE